jgi:hypothetical protein
VVATGGIVARMPDGAWIDWRLSGSERTVRFGILSWRMSAALFGWKRRGHYVLACVVDRHDFGFTVGGVKHAVRSGDFVFP